MYCTNCSNEMSDRAVMCVKCGVATGVGQTTLGVTTVSAAKSRTTYILLGLFLGGIGIHNFYAGYTSKAVAQLLITLLTFWLILPLIAVGVWVIVEIATVKADSQGITFV
jgi:TM2 domain-containing membrane protein YozV